ncbi:hypothetical protein WI41_01710 [Burkholderia latens]|uniref:Uncharacterized protein n=1 Tax=Burkholderia latens TaxID=488446 RepID=A0AAP1C298_9BURK|nr:hypothetical protein WI41_01710 [Burkholderia latens]
MRPRGSAGVSPGGRCRSASCPDGQSGPASGSISHNGSTSARAANHDRIDCIGHRLATPALGRLPFLHACAATPALPTAFGPRRVAAGRRDHGRHTPPRAGPGAVAPAPRQMPLAARTSPAGVARFAERASVCDGVMPK